MLKLPLRAEQRGKASAPGHQRGVVALLADTAVLHVQNAVRRRHVGQTVGDDRHASKGAEGADDLHDDALALGVDVAGGLIENIDPLGGGEVDGQRQALLLPAGDVRRVLVQHKIKAAPLPHKAVQPHKGKRPPHFLLRRVRVCQQEVGAYGVVKEKGFTAHMGEGSVIRLPVEAFDRLAG